MFVMTLATLVTFLIYNYILTPFEITYLQTISYILVVASLVQMVEIILKKVSPALYQALGIFLPLIVTNCAILGVTILAVREDYGFHLLEAVVFSIGHALASPLPSSSLQVFVSTSTLSTYPKACAEHRQHS